MKLVAAKCPSCGANIKVDRSLKFTKCEYCDSEIMVEEAVENLLKVELKDTPTLDNYLKLGNRYYENQEFGEAYKAYSKAEEIDPDNPLVVLRKGLSKSMISEYNNFDVNSAINGLKNSLELMKKMKFSRKDMNQSIDDTGAVLYVSKKYLMDVYQNNKLTKAQTAGYIERMEACLNGFIYLDEVLEGDSALEAKIVDTIIDTIDVILGNAGDTKYHLSSSYVTELKNKKKEYEKRSGSKSVNRIPTRLPDKAKVVEVESHTSKIKDILCYVAIFFFVLFLLGSIFSNDSIWMILVLILLIISFVPFIKKTLVQKYGVNIGKIIVLLRVILIVLAIVLISSGPVEFENTFKAQNGVEEVTFNSGKFTMKIEDTIIKGEYHWDTKDNDYYIHVQGNNNENYEYRYRETDEGGSLCLLKNDTCSEIYLPVN